MSQAVMQQSGVMPDNGIMMKTSEDPVKLPQLRSTMDVDRSKPLPTSLQSDFIPDDVLFALTQPPVPRDKLGPPSRVRNLNTTMTLARAPPSNLWNHKRREKFKHLLDTTSCSCGAGKDISFLYDVPQEFGHPEKADTIDKSAMRKDAEMPPRKALQLPDTLIPTEYHVVKNKGVMGIEYHEDKYTTNPEDHEKHLIVFPSMKPSSRYEVVQLRKTMDEMLEKVGFNDLDVDIKGPTQMHNLLELIKKEQNIYNVVFHELIRQTSVECSDRGELLSELRSRYSQLLGKVPQQIMSLHEEVMAQRALDRRLTDELMRFKNTIAILTSELSDVKEHDKVVTREAQKTQEDLRHALAEAQKNAALLSEYHDLYELQRRRLEHQVFVLSEEREIWSTAAYSLALKVTEECRLVTAKRLHVSEKAWAKLANHFTILLSDRDTDLLTQIQGHVDRWRDAVEDFNIALRQREEEMKDELKSLKGGVARWILDFQRHCFNKDGHLVKPPNKEKMMEIQADFKEWERVLAKEAEFFGGDLLLSNQDELSQIRREMEGWTDNALKVFSRHRGTTGAPHPEQKAMLILNEEVDGLLEQYQYRITGENGVASIVIQLQNVVETWEARVIAALNDTMPIQDSDWSSFYQSLDDWVASLDQAQEYVGTTQTEEERQEGKPHVSIDIHQVVRKTQKWATTASNSIDSEDAKLVEQVSTLHSEMVRWMVQTLLRLAPDKEGNSKEAADMALLGSDSIPQLHENAKQLFQLLESFSSYVTLIGLYAKGCTIWRHWWESNDPNPLLERMEQEIKWKKQQEERRRKESVYYTMEESECSEEDTGEDQSSHSSKSSQTTDSEHQLGESCVDEKQAKSLSVASSSGASSEQSPLDGQHPRVSDTESQHSQQRGDGKRSEQPDTGDKTCCNGIVMDNTQKRQDMNEDNADHELRDLRRLRTECEDWIHTSKILISQLTGESIEDLFPQRSSTTLSKSSQPAEQGQSATTVTFRDHEKLDTSVGGDGPSQTSQESKEPDSSEEAGEKTSQEEEADQLIFRRSSIWSRLMRLPVEAEKSPSPSPAKSATPTKPATPQTSKTEQMEMLGHDENTHLTGLQDARQDLATTPVKVAGIPDTKKAFEALAAVNSLQDQLIMTEQRAQEAEERAATAESELATTQELLRSLQKQMEKLTGSEQLSAPTSGTSMAQPASPTPSQQQTLESPRQTSTQDAKGDVKKKESRTKSSGKVKKK